MKKVLREVKLIFYTTAEDEKQQSFDRAEVDNLIDRQDNALLDLLDKYFAEPGANVEVEMKDYKRPKVLVTINEGVGDTESDGDVDVCLVDWDNIREGDGPPDDFTEFADAFAHLNLRKDMEEATDGRYNASAGEYTEDGDESVESDDDDDN